MSKIPEIKWRQDKEFVNLSFKVLDASKADIKFTEQQVDFKATTDEHVEYAVVLECFNEIDPKNSSYQILGREVYVKLKKTEAKSWPKLLKSGKPYYLKADWSHTLYDSEDEAEPEIGGFGMDGMGPMDYGDMGMGGDFPNDCDSCSDDCGKEEETKESDDDISKESDAKNPETIKSE